MSAEGNFAAKTVTPNTFIGQGDQPDIKGPIPEFGHVVKSLDLPISALEHFLGFFSA